MDVLKPQLLWLGKRCYRINNNIDTNEQQNQKPATTNEYIEDDLYAENDDDDADCQDEYEVIEIAPNRYKTTFHVPQAFFGAIIGAKGAVRKRIEGETRTEITIPKHGSSENDIKILGTKRDAVCTARRRIDLIVTNCRRKQPPTHFTCVRIDDANIKSNYIKFKEEIQQNGPTYGLQEKMFTEADKLHITIGVMCLMDDVDRTAAIELLNDCRETLIVPIKNEHGQIKVSVCGVNIMNDDPKCVRYLYGKIQSDALQQIGDGILKRFIDAGLAKREFDRDSVKLHMTLINATSGSTDEDDGDNNGGGGGGGSRSTDATSNNRNKFRTKGFDARNILDKYADYEFGQQFITEIHLAIMKSSDSQNGFYKCTTSVQF